MMHHLMVFYSCCIPIQITILQSIHTNANSKRYHAVFNIFFITCSYILSAMQLDGSTVVFVGVLNKYQYIRNIYRLAWLNQWVLIRGNSLACHPEAPVLFLGDVGIWVFVLSTLFPD